VASDFEKKKKKTNQIFDAKRMKDNFKYCQKKNPTLLFMA
jgi:hypothetical protein